MLEKLVNYFKKIRYSYRTVECFDLEIFDDHEEETPFYLLYYRKWFKWKLFEETFDTLLKAEEFIEYHKLHKKEFKQKEKERLRRKRLKMKQEKEEKIKNKGIKNYF